jgi:hypothetical protein
MKKLILSAILFAALKGQAFTYRGWDGYWYGNVCRTGMYYQIVPYQAVNTYCFMPAWNAWGVITLE